MRRGEQQPATRKRALVAGLAVLAACALAWWQWTPLPTRSAAPATFGAPAEAASPTTAADAAAHAPAAPPDTEPQMAVPATAEPAPRIAVTGGPTLRVLRARDREPLTGTRVFLAPGPDVLSIRERGEMLGVTDAQGLVSLDVMPPLRVVIRHQEHVPVAMTLEGGEQELLLHDGHTLQIRAVRPDGSTRPGCSVVLTRTTLDPPPDHGHQEFANPDAIDGIWTTLVEQDGVATLRGLPDRRWLAYVLHRHHAAVEPWAQGFAPPPQQDGTLQVTMRPLAALWACAAPGERIVAHDWLATSGLDAAHPAARRAAEQLLRREPGSICFVTPIENADLAPIVQLRATLQDAARVSHEQPLIPLRQLDRPVPISRAADTSMRLVRIDLRSGARLLPDVELTLRHDTAPPFTVRTGTPFRAASGSYRVNPATNQPALEDHFATARIEIPADASPMHVIELAAPTDLVEVVLNLNSPAALPRPSKLSIDGDDDWSLTTFAWQTNPAPIRILTKPGRLHIELTSNSKVLFATDLLVRGDLSPLPVQVTPTSRSR